MTCPSIHDNNKTGAELDDKSSNTDRREDGDMLEEESWRMIHPINLAFIAVRLSPARMTILGEFSDHVCQFTLEATHAWQVNNMLWETIVYHDTIEERCGIETMIAIHFMYK